MTPSAQVTATEECDSAGGSHTPLFTEWLSDVPTDSRKGVDEDEAEK